MYYSSNAEEELGFDAFIAPDDFDRHAQPVDIYEVFKYWYARGNQARYIYYYSDGNYPLTLTPTTDEYYKYGYRTGGVDVVVDIPLSTQGGVATTIWGASGNTSGNDESGFTHRWVIVYRVSTAKFELVLTTNTMRALWLYCGDKVLGINKSPAGVYHLKWTHMANINSFTSNFAQVFGIRNGNQFYSLGDRIYIPETIVNLAEGCFLATGIRKVNLPETKAVGIFMGGNADQQSFPWTSLTEFNIGRTTPNISLFPTYLPNLQIVSVSEPNPTLTSFNQCDILFSKDKTIIHWLAPKTVRGLYLPDELPQSQIDLLGTKLSANIMANHQLYIGNQITNLTNLYLSNKSFVTIEVGVGNTAFVVENGILYNSTKTQLIKAGTYNTGDLIIPNTVTEILANSFLRCSGYNGNLTIPSSVTSIAGSVFNGLTQLTSLTLPLNYDTSIYNYFGFANFSAESLNDSILNLMDGTSGSPKFFYISKTSLDALNAAYPNAVSNAALRFINVVANIVQDESLKLWLDASNPLSYPGTGTLWSDLSGNGNNGTMVNGVTYNTANGGVMSFDGVNDYVTLGNVLNIGLGDFSYGFVAILKQSTTKGIFGKTIAGSIVGRWGIFTEGGLLFVLIQTGTIANTIFSIPAAPHLNSYKHYFVSIDRDGNMELYINNMLAGSVAMTDPTTNLVTSGNVYVGAYGNSTGAAPGAGMYNNNDINDIVVYNRILTANERTQNFNATRHKYGI